MTILLANNLTLPEHSVLDLVNGDSELIAEAVEFLEFAAKDTGDATIHKLHAASDELHCRARVAGNNFFRSLQTKTPSTTSLAWLEEEAMKSASYSALDLVAAFTQAAVKPLVTRVSGNNLEALREAI